MHGCFFPFLGILAVIFLQHVKNMISLSQLVLLNHAEDVMWRMHFLNLLFTYINNNNLKNPYSWVHQMSWLQISTGQCKRAENLLSTIRCLPLVRSAVFRFPSHERSGRSKIFLVKFLPAL